MHISDWSSDVCSSDLQLMGDNFHAKQFDQDKFQQSVLDDMTQESMLRQYTDKIGYRANDAALFNAIAAIPAFQTDGKFNTENYRSALARQGLTPTRFEAQLRQSLEIDQIDRKSKRLNSSH